MAMSSPAMVAGPSVLPRSVAAKTAVQSGSVLMIGATTPTRPARSA